MKERKRSVNVYMVSGPYHLFSAVSHRIVDSPSGHAVAVCFNYENSGFQCEHIFSSKIFDYIFQLTSENRSPSIPLTRSGLKMYQKEIYPHVKIVIRTVIKFGRINNIYLCGSYRPYKVSGK